MRDSVMWKYKTVKPIQNILYITIFINTPYKLSI